MALLFADSFDTYATSDFTQVWTQIITTLSGNPTIGATGRRSTNGLRFPNVSSDECKPVAITLAPADSTFIVGFAFKQTGAFGNYTINSNLSIFTSSAGSGSSQLIHVRTSGTTHLVFRIKTNGQIEVLRGDGTLLGSTTAALQVGVFAYLEFKGTIDNSTGAVDIRINSASVLSLTGVDTQNGATATWDEIVIGKMANADAITLDIDDLYVCDGSGGASDDFLGDVAVDAIYPNGAGTHSDGTPSTGSDQYAVVDETPMNGDTDYNTLAAVSDRDSFAFPNAPVASATILGVQVKIQARLDSGGTAGLKASTRIGGTDYDGAESAVGGSYAVHRQIWDVKPSDSTPWVDTDINAAEFGYLKSA